MLSSSLRRAGSKSTDASVTQVRRASTSSDFFKLLAKSKASRKRDGYDIKRMKGIAAHLVAGAKQSQNPEWRHTYGKKREAKRLEQDIVGNMDPLLHDGRSNASIFADHPLENWTMEDLVQSGTSVLQPGTYFELRRNADATNGVVLGPALDNLGYNEDTMSINTRGEIILHRTSDIMFAVPNFVDRYLIERCGRAQVHEDQHQLAARLRVLKAARDFDRSVEKEQYRLGHAMGDIYPRVCARSPDEWGKVTTMQVARMLDATPNVPIVTLFAVHRQLMDRADEFICHPNRHRFVHTFDVRPLSHLRNIENVKQMVRNKSPVIRGFQDKAKPLIDRSRKLAMESIGEPPSRAEVVKQKFTPKEQEIITFLKLSMSQGRRIQQDSYEGNVPAIIKDTFKYDELITSYVTLKFLREIGVYTPWEDMASKDKDLHLPEVTDDPVIRPVTSDTLDSTALATQTQIPGLTADAHESVRHDFGDLPVYVIDDAYAEELDDGISIEAVPGEPDTNWLHVHVADPTAIVPITHPLSQEIQKRTESIYFGHQTWPMLPREIGALCDMGRADVLAAGQNVLTFSAKIGPGAQITDCKVRTGRVHNVHKLKYDDVNGILLSRVPPNQFTPFEPQAATSTESHDISYVLPHADDLKLAYEVTRRLVNDRLRKDVFSFSLNVAEVTFLDKPVLQNPSHVMRPILHRGYPRLRYSVSKLEAYEIGARSLIAECMKVAGRVASRFCVEHNIPAVRRAMTNIDLDDVKFSRILAARDEMGFVDPPLLIREGVLFPPGELTTKPAGHWGLGIPDGEGYVRATSPLRRAEDMLVHWQIKSALLPGGGAFPPIDEGRMTHMAEDLNGRKQVLRKAYRAHHRQWTHTYIQRFMDEQARAGKTAAESNPLRGMDAYVVQNPVYNVVRWSMYQDVCVPKLGMNAVMPVKGGIGVPVGERIKVNATTVFQYDLNHTLEVALA